MWERWQRRQRRQPGTTMLRELDCTVAQLLALQQKGPQQQTNDLQYHIELFQYAEGMARGGKYLELTRDQRAFVATRLAGLILRRDPKIEEICAQHGLRLDDRLYGGETYDGHEYWTFGRCDCGCGHDDD